MSHTRSVSLFAVSLVVLAVASAAAETTSAVVTVSGSRRVVVLSGNGEERNGRAVFVGRETIEITPRGPDAEVVVYTRGIPEVDLYIDDGSQATVVDCVPAPNRTLNLNLKATTRIGYRYCIPVDTFEKAHGSVLVVSGNRDPETIPLDFESAESLLESATGTTLMSVLLVGLGAIVGLVTSTIQQRIAIGAQQRSTFWQKMMEKQEELSEFFDEYRKKHSQPTTEGDQDDARRIRRLLSKQGAYAIMAPPEIRKLNRICDGWWAGVGQRRLGRLDRLIRRTFSEVMRQD